MVIRYAYLWQSEHERGIEEGGKDRPCAVLLAMTDDAGDQQVIVLPITHSPPYDPTTAIEIPAATKRRLNLDDDRSWVILEEANRFIWPGPDLRPMKSGNMTTVVFGELPADLFRKIRERWLALSASRRSVVTRTE